MPNLRRSGGGFLATFELEPDPLTGKRRQRVMRFTGPEAEAKRRFAAVAKQMVERPSGRGDLTLNMLIDEYLNCGAFLELRTKTQRRYRGVIDHQIRPLLGDRRLATLKKAHIQAALHALQNTPSPKTGRPLSAESLHFVHVMLNALFTYATEHGFITVSPMTGIRRPKLQQPTITPLTMEQTQAMVAAVERPEYRRAIDFAAWTGLRRGEVLGLRWLDVDLPAGHIHVRQALEGSGKKAVPTQLKTRGSVRYIDLGKAAVDLLHEQRQWQETFRRELGAGFDQRGLGLVFTDALGVPLATTTLDRQLKRALEQLGLPPVGMHNLRHAHATTLIELGVPHRVVQERLGHASITTTLDRYGHVTPGMQRAAAEALDQARRPRDQKCDQTGMEAGS